MGPSAVFVPFLIGYLLCCGCVIMRATQALPRIRWLRVCAVLGLAFAAIALIENTGARVVGVPACSPDLNPIELMWSKVKALLRVAQASTRESLPEAIGKALATVSAQDAQNWFAH